MKQLSNLQIAFIMNNLKAQILKTLHVRLSSTIMREVITGSPYSRVIHQCQYKFIFRELSFQTFKEDASVERISRTQMILKRLAHQKLNRKRYQNMRLQTTPQDMAHHVIDQFYNKGHFAWWNVLTHYNVVINRNVLADLLWGAIGPPRINREWRTSNVISLLRSMRSSEDFSTMPILSDALMDAGCDDSNLLMRLREASYFSLGDWLFKVTGLIG